MTEKQKTSELILVVEDDADISCFLLHLLEEEYQVVLATNGIQALNLVQGLTPALFILNYHLPHMTGIELYDRLHALEPLRSVPAMMLSANLPYEEIKQRGIVGLSKPVDIDELMNMIERLISNAKRRV